MEKGETKKIKFWKPGTIAPGLDGIKDQGNLNIREDEDELLLAASLTPSFDKSIEEIRKSLPIYRHRREFLYTLSSGQSQVLIVCGQTGSGKTTQLAQYLVEAGYPGIIACTQPRRIAAITVAQRVTEEMNTLSDMNMRGELGDVVGYAVRFEERCSTRTRIKYLTDGILVREAMLDPLLVRYSVIIVDEAHERTIHTDILLALLKKILLKRTDLKVVIASATINVQIFQKFFTLPSFPPPSIMSVQGRSYPVEIFYYESKDTEGEEPSLVECTYNTILQIHKQEGPGDVLVFLPGREEIDRCKSALSEGTITPPLWVVSLVGGTEWEEQVKAFEAPPIGYRKVVLATNVAETSVTIDGIVYVVDSGLVKQRIYDPRTGYSALLTTPISRASAKQRAGRAGRLKAGKCFRLYGEAAYWEHFEEFSLPEILKCDLIPVALQLKALGIDNLLTFDFISSPAPLYWARTLEYLHVVQAINEKGDLSREVGLPMAELPLEPMLARALLSASSYGCRAEAIIVAAMQSSQPIFYSTGTAHRDFEKIQQKLCVQEGDLVSMVNIFRQYQRMPKGQRAGWCRRNYLRMGALTQAQRLRILLNRYLKRLGMPNGGQNDDDDDDDDDDKMIKDLGQLRDAEYLIKCLATGYFPNIAQLQADGSYRRIQLKGGKGGLVYIHPSSCLFKQTPPWVMYCEVVETGKRYMRGVTVIEPFWLADIAPHYYDFEGGRQAVTI